VSDGKIRCSWATGDPQLADYHDQEWGVPLHDDRALFELFALEGAQAGLSWITVLRRRDAYRRAFHNFDIATVAGFSSADVERLLGDASLIRNRRKIASVVENARQIPAIVDECGSFDRYLWDFVGGRPIDTRVEQLSDLPASTAESTAMSKSLRRRGFSFVGPTICYALMQSAGMTNDHVRSCFRHDAVARLASSARGDGHREAQPGVGCERP
jgi:DNA-3-methyladenine glycosylase I